MASSQDTFKKFKEFLLVEAKSIEAAAEQIDEKQVDHAIEMISTSQGKVIVSGVGKSGDVGKKIAATLNSLGIVAVFLHPADALHGDLGVTSEGDVIIALSNSGETDEILVMLPHLKRRDINVISIVGNNNSSLARRSDAVLLAHVDREACPFNLAPTASTTVALAIGDALAIAVAERKGITKDQFAFNHPAGRLGKRLTLTVADLMHDGDRNPTVNPGDSWLKVVGTISAGGLGAVSVVDSAHKLIGLITDGDLRRTIEATPSSKLDTVNAAKIMTANPTKVGPDCLAYDALRLLEDRPRQINELPVVDEKDKAIGLIRVHDLVSHGLA